MSNLELANKIWSDNDFQSVVRFISKQSAAQDFSRLGGTSTEEFKVDWFHLLRCASVFISDTDEYFHEIGLRILHGCLTSSADSNSKGLSAALLAKAASNPSVSLAVSRGLVAADVLDRLPFDLSIDVAAHQIAATINIGSEQEFIGNDFRAQLWKTLNNSDWVSTSAPTSAGKSYVLEKWIEHTVTTHERSTTFYIVPTRALITQVESDLRQMLSDRIDDINISSLPLVFSERQKHTIYIYTQERFHLYLLQNKTADSAQLVIIDEAQKIGADRRGILLQQVLELASEKYDNAKFLFASPSTDNPESLLAFAPDGKRLKVVSGTRPTVNQNLIWVEQVPRYPSEWDFSLLVDGSPVSLGRLSLEAKPSVAQKLPFIAEAIGGANGGNVIYVNRAADAEKTAEILCQFIAEEQDDPELRALSEFCEKAVHPRFMLRRFVRKGVAFHYGNIPQLIRTEVERLFSTGKIKYLVCTSTLVEGVNLSCRNIFLRNPKRGSKELMSPEDFWNLAGRAGRWGREFQGNIFCIDPRKANEWPGGSAPRFKTKHRITIATHRLSKEYEDFLLYVRNDAESLSSKNRFHEQLLSYLVFRYSTFGDLGASLPSSGLSSEQIGTLEAEIIRVIKSIRVPIEIVHRNPGINPYGFAALYDYFDSKSPDEFDDLIPADPLSDAAVPDSDPDADLPQDFAVENFIAVFTRISKYLQGPLGSGNSAFGNVLLVIHWMRGYPLTRIIDGQIRYWSKRGKSPTAIIRETMERVEKIARFETPKYLHCYIDVLLYFFDQKGYAKPDQRLEDFWLYLEFGVSKRTQLSLMSLGLSRSTVTALSDYIKEDNLDEARCLQWLSSNPWPEFGLPQLVNIEIASVLRRYNRPAPPLTPEEAT